MLPCQADSVSFEVKRKLEYRTSDWHRDYEFAVVLFLFREPYCATCFLLWIESGGQKRTVADLLVVTVTLSGFGPSVFCLTISLIDLLWRRPVGVNIYLAR